MPRQRSRAITKIAERKIDFDGAYLMRFDGDIAWKDRHSSYAASFAELLDGSLIYIAERIQGKWYYGIWNPVWEWQYDSLGACRKAIREDFKIRLNNNSNTKRISARDLYFPKMQWSRNYAFRHLDFEKYYCDDDYFSDNISIKITAYGLNSYDYNSPIERMKRTLEGLDYTVWFAYAHIDKQERIHYVIERIGKKWLGSRWSGAQEFAGTTMRECQVAIWRHMTEWYRSDDMRKRIALYQSHTK